MYHVRLFLWSFSSTRSKSAQDKVRSNGKQNYCLKFVGQKPVKGTTSQELKPFECMFSLLMLYPVFCLGQMENEHVPITFSFTSHTKSTTAQPRQCSFCTLLAVFACANSSVFWLHEQPPSLKLGKQSHSRSDALCIKLEIYTSAFWYLHQQLQAK